ncbi:MAG: hypothetical protein AAGA83_16595 [Cyanobacteria bacterium P01_F01_bin.116]
MNNNRQRLQVLSQQQQESENHLTEDSSVKLSIPWRFVRRGSYVVGIVVLVIHLTPNVAAKLNFDGSIEWNPPDSTELQK